VQVDRTGAAGIRDHAQVAALVAVAFSAMQRLVDVAHKMNDGLQRLDAWLARGMLVGETLLNVWMASTTQPL